MLFASYTQGGIMSLCIADTFISSHTTFCILCRKLHSEGLLQRTGHGGRPDPFKWTKVETTGTSQLSPAAEA